MAKATPRPHFYLPPGVSPPIRPSNVPTTSPSALPSASKHNTQWGLAWDAANLGEPVIADKELKSITQPAIEGVARLAVDYYFATQSAENAGNGRIASALSELAQVTLPDVRTATERGFDNGTVQAALRDVEGENYSDAEALEPELSNAAQVSVIDAAIIGMEGGQDNRLITPGSNTQPPQSTIYKT